MMDGFQNLQRSHATVPEQYKPYSCTELTEKQIKFAREFLNETEETRSKYLRRFKRFIDNELEEYSDLKDIHCLAILRTRKFNFKEARLLMKNAAEFAEANKEYLKKIDTKIVRQVIDSKIIGFLPYRDAKGRAIIYIKSENWNPDDLNAEDLIFGGLVALHTTAENPVNQVSGYVLIHDFKNIYFNQYRAMVTWLVFLINGLKNCAPIVINEIHLVHSPSLFLILWNVVYPFLDESIKAKITFYGSEDFDKLHERIPPCILPEEIGGYLGPFSNDHWATDISSITKNFFNIIHKVLQE